MKNKIVNIVNFIRGIEPRGSVDLHKPVAWQMEMARKYNLPTTWLLQYDALLDNFYVDLLRQAPDSHEVGIWFEVVQPMTEACGIPWRGRFPWDWHTDVGFSIGYSPEEREKLADEFIRLFVEKFGQTPKSMGSWIFDAHLLEYLKEKHGIESACNCKDQLGTDGYTLWGGYWANGYYPCRKNAYLPAQSQEEQISVPVFRMLGSDPIYQYEADPEMEYGQPVVSLEPVYAHFGKKPAGGGNQSWVDWFFRNEFADPVMTMGYIQAGQENSFGYNNMHDGLEYQYPLIARLRDEGKFSVATLGETGRWFSRNFSVTPASSVCALEDWDGGGRESVWYMTRFGRINLSREQDGSLIIRDWQLNSEKYEEPFLKSVCRSSSCIYDALPICDGMRWGARLRFMLGETPLSGTYHQIISETDDTLCVECGDADLRLVLRNETICISNCNRNFSLRMERKLSRGCLWRAVNDRTIEYVWNGMCYQLEAEKGRIVIQSENRFDILPDGSELALKTRVV